MDTRIQRIRFAVIWTTAALPNGNASARTARITVTNTNDSGSGSLRQELTDAHDGDFINFAAALNGQTIILTSGELFVNKSITIAGPGAANLSVDANGMSGVLHIGSGTTVSTSGLTIIDGNRFFPNDGNGGGVLNDDVNSDQCAVGPNGADNGGGIYSDGSNGSATLRIINCTVSGNYSPFGGGIFNDGYEGSAALTIVDSAVNDNLSTNGNPPYDFGSAGGIASFYGTVTITNSTISGNSASNDGGGILYGGTLTITNSTISGNRAGGVGQNN